MGEAKRRAGAPHVVGADWRARQALAPRTEWAQIADVGPDGETVIGSKDAKHHAPNRKQRRSAEALKRRVAP